MLFVGTYVPGRKRTSVSVDIGIHRNLINLTNVTIFHGTKIIKKWSQWLGGYIIEVISDSIYVIDLNKDDWTNKVVKGSY